MDLYLKKLTALFVLDNMKVTDYIKDRKKSHFFFRNYSTFEGEGNWRYLQRNWPINGIQSTVYQRHLSQGGIWIQKNG